MSKIRFLKAFWLKPFLFKLVVTVSRSSSRQHFCICVSQGWSQVEVPNGWVQLIRGPRPKSVQWPRATRKRSRTKCPPSNSWPVVAYTEKRDSLRAEERLARLQDEVGRGGQDGHPVPNPQFHIPPEVFAELDRLRSMVANSMFEGTGGSVAGDLNPVERPQVRQRVDPVPYMPHNGWRTARQISKRPSVRTTLVAFWN